MPFRSGNGKHFGSFCTFLIVSSTVMAAACFLILSPKATVLFSVLCLKIFLKKINGFCMSGYIMRNTTPRPFENRLTEMIFSKASAGKAGKTMPYNPDFSVNTWRLNSEGVSPYRFLKARRNVCVFA